MASNLLKTFQKIEQGRQSIVTALRNQGNEVPDSASFVDLANYITVPQSHKEPYEKIRREPWVRPTYWPDSHTIFAEAPTYSGVVPGIFVLQEVYADSAASIVFPMKVNTSGVYTYQTYAASVLTSDGNYYDLTSAAVTHTWDETKYIEIEGHKFRWYILYYTTTTYATSYMNLIDHEAVEVLIGDIYCTGKFYGGVVNSFSLINLEFLDSCQVVNISAYNKSGGSCLNVPSLEHLSANKIKNFSSTNYVYPFNYSMCYLKSINLPVLGTDVSGYYMPASALTEAPNICEVNFNATLAKSKRISMSKQNPLFDTCKQAGWNMYICDDFDIVADKPLPNYDDVDVKNGLATYLKRTTQFQYCVPLVVNLPNLVTLDLSSYTNAGSVYVNSVANQKYIRPYYNCDSLSEIIFPTSCIYRYDFTRLDVPVQILRDLIYALEDLTVVTDTYYYPYQRLGVENLAKLTATEIAEAAAKGWVLT